jgi:hypothetical protein
MVGFTLWAKKEKGKKGKFIRIIILKKISENYFVNF